MKTLHDKIYWFICTLISIIVIIMSIKGIKKDPDWIIVLIAFIFILCVEISFLFDHIADKYDEYVDKDPID